MKIMLIRRVVAVNDDDDDYTGGDNKMMVMTVMMMIVMMMVMTIMLTRLGVMYIRLRMMDDTSMDAKFDDFAKRHGPTLQQTDTVAHPKREEQVVTATIVFSRVHATL